MTPNKPVFNHPPLENPLKLLRENLASDKRVYDIEPDLLKWALFQTPIWVKRFAMKDSPTFTGTDRTAKNYSGLLGQKIFEITLQQYEIPYAPNDPTLDWSAKKKYDFKIPHVGTIEVKTAESGLNRIRIIVNRSEWHSSNYCVAIKINDPIPSFLWTESFQKQPFQEQLERLERIKLTATFAGYAKRTEVEQEFERADYEFPCNLFPCYWQLLDKLHNANVFLSMLQKQTAQCWN